MEREVFTLGHEESGAEVLGEREGQGIFELLGRG